MTPKICAKRIRDARAEKGYSQRALALRVGLSDKSISAYEKGHVYPPVANLILIAKVLERPISYFLED